MKALPKAVVFTDLDGTLLDAETYSFEDALPALDELRRLGIPVVPCTSKTAAETRYFLEQMGLRTPYIVEGGAAVYLPTRIFPGSRPAGEVRDDCRVVKLAVGYDEVLRGIAALRIHTGGAIRGFHDMTLDEVTHETGLSPELARLARKREFDEPFQLLLPESRWPADLEDVAHDRGLQLSRGGRFWHLHGGCDKGRALELVISLYRRLWGGRVTTIGLGDSAHDLPLLRAVDVPIIIPKPDGRPDRTLKQGAPVGSVVASMPGPAGWSREVLKVLDEKYGECIFNG